MIMIMFWFLITYNTLLFSTYMFCKLIGINLFKYKQTYLKNLIICKFHKFSNRFKITLIYSAIIISLLLFTSEKEDLQGFLHIHKKLKSIQNLAVDNQKIKYICLSLTNSFVKDIINRIKNGGPFYYNHDGTQLHNFERTLPQQSSPSNIYYEYTVGPFDMANRGAERIITDNMHLHWFYTQDHYISFLEIKSCQNTSIVFPIYLLKLNLPYTRLKKSKVKIQYV